MPIDKLTTLEYPRHVHKPEGAYLRVDNSVECEAALEDGWSIDVPVDVPAVADVADVADVDAVIDAKPTKPAHKGKR